MKINWWLVAAITMLLTSIGGMIAALLLNTGFLLWALFSAVCYNIIRTEWIISAAIMEYEKDD